MHDNWSFDFYIGFNYYLLLFFSTETSLILQNEMRNVSYICFIICICSVNIVHKMVCSVYCVGPKAH